ncbi:MAG: flagellar biosynthetic protein FliO [Myxococcales bacterium]|nr:flagellar biosynthetic protein FliO [Myxococcales bacterium]
MAAVEGSGGARVARWTSHDQASRWGRRLLAAHAGLIAAGCGAAADSLGAMLLRTSLVLIAVGALAVVSLRGAARLTGATQRTREKGARLELIDELPVGPRQALLAVRAGDRILVVARTATHLTPVADLAADVFARRAFADILATAQPPTLAAEDEDREAGVSHAASAAKSPSDLDEIIA